MAPARKSLESNRGNRINRDKNIGTLQRWVIQHKKGQKMNSATAEVAYITSSAIVRECHISVNAEKLCSLSRRAVLHGVVGCIPLLEIVIFFVLDNRSRFVQIKSDWNIQWVYREISRWRTKLQFFVNNSCYFTNNGSGMIIDNQLL